VGESLVETLTMKVQFRQRRARGVLARTLHQDRQRPGQVTNAERVALDGQALMADPTLRSVMLLLGYEQIGDEVPVRLDACW
jgi:hypothetical protein